MHSNIRKLRKFPEFSPLKEGKEEPFARGMQFLSECILELKNEISSLTHKDDEEFETDLVEERFKKIKINVPSNMKLLNNTLSLPIKQWLGKLLKRSFSSGFELFQEKKLSEKQAKSYCSENIIYHFLQFIRLNHFDASEIRLMNDFIQKELLNYLLIKYPISEDKETNSALSKIVVPLKTKSNTHDLIFKSDIKFSYNKSGNYNGQIMTFLNYVLQLPSNQMQIQQEALTLENLFHREIQNLFEMIEDAQSLKKMKKTQSKSQKYEVNLFDPKKPELTDEQASYAEKVHEYTNYATHRKLSSNIAIYSENEIEEGNLELRNSSLRRIVTKWCEELKNNYSNLEERKEPFRMQDNSERFMKLTDLEVLIQILKREKQHVEENIMEIMKNNYQQQELLSKETFYEEISYFSDFEVKVGLFNAHMLKNNNNYLVNYLNTLIHGLLKATERYSYYVLDGELSYNSEEDIDEFIERCKRSCEQKNKQLSEHHKAFIPNLLSFNVGDLLRSKCSSKESEITALYRELLKINHHQPDLLKITKVKNRLKNVTKDILINMVYRNELIIQMQLAIKTEKSSFLEHSDKFNHFIYELKRGTFGPLIELSNVWMSADPRAQFYSEKTSQLQRYRQPPKKYSGPTKNIEMILPFKCVNCEKYFNNVSECKNHRFSERENSTICISCAIGNISTYAQLREIFPELPERTQNYEIVREEIPQSGEIINIFSKIVSIQEYKKIVKGDKIMLFTRGQKRIEKLAELKRDEVEEFMQKHIILNRKQQSSITQLQLYRQYFNPLALKEAYKNEEQTILINKAHLDDATLNCHSKMKYKNAKKICFMENDITQIVNFGKIFPSVEILLLNCNSISQLGPECSQLETLQELYLEGNRIASVSPQISKLQHLTVLCLEENKCLQSLPQSISTCKNLQTLTLARCEEIQSLPDSFGASQSLKHASFLGCKKLKQLPQFKSCSKFKVIDLSECSALTSLPESIGKCNQLTTLRLSKCHNIAHLPQSIGEIKKLILLDISYCSALSTIPQEIGQCSQLSTLVMKSCRQVRSLPSALINCQRLASLNLRQCESLAELPQKLGNFTELVFFDVCQCFKLTGIPLSILECKKMERLSLCECDNSLTILQQAYTFSALTYLGVWMFDKMLQLPAKVGHCSELTFLHLKKCSKITKLPWTLGNCKKLSSLIVEQCQNLVQVPQSLGSCQSLSYLSFSGCTKLTVLPKRLGKCRKLIEFSLKGCTEIEMIPETFQNCHEMAGVDLSNCTNLKELPEAIGDFTKLVVMQLSGCQNLTNIPESIGNCRHLSSLSLLNCSQVKSLPKTLINCQELKRLMIEESLMKHVPIDEFKSLKIIR